MARGVYADIHASNPRTPAPGSVSLRELRERLGVTQATVARGADMSQGDVSRLERRTDWLYTSLERYAAGMGGHVELYIVVNGQRYLVDP